MIEFTVIRSQWSNGKDLPTVKTEAGEEISYNHLLVKDTNKKCCAGFLANELGFSDDEIRGKSCLLDLTLPITINIGVMGSICRVNDSVYMTEQEREKRLKILFEKINIKINFVD